MFGKNKSAILSTTLIVKVRKFKDQEPYFSLYSTPSMASEENAKDVVAKLNAVEQYNTADIKEGWQTEYYSVPMTL
jgi:hypothetical protein|tara:strand:- start:9 stop:236 length:228 start_codon:yes stop_codon:yes gene_type:complete